MILNKKPWLSLDSQTQLCTFYMCKTRVVNRDKNCFSLSLRFPLPSPRKILGEGILSLFRGCECRRGPLAEGRWCPQQVAMQPDSSGHPVTWGTHRPPQLLTPTSGGLGFGSWERHSQKSPHERGCTCVLCGMGRVRMREALPKCTASESPLGKRKKQLGNLSQSCLKPHKLPIGEDGSCSDFQGNLHILSDNTLSPHISFTDITQALPPTPSLQGIESQILPFPQIVLHSLKSSAEKHASL